MFKYLLWLIATLSLNFTAKSQPSNSDTICISVGEAKKLLSAAKQRDILLEQVSLINTRIAEKDTIISLLRSKDQNNSSIISTQEQQKKVLEDEKKLLLDTIAQKNKELKREKFKRIVT